MFEAKKAGSGRLVANLREYHPLKLSQFKVFKTLLKKHTNTDRIQSICHECTTPAAQ